MDADRPSEARRQLLVIANRTCPCAELHEEIASRSGGAGAEVMVVAPALNSRLRHYVSDSDEAAANATERLDAAVTDLENRGFQARGEIGDADPLQAIDDALHGFRADELIISTYPPSHSNWLEKDLVARAREQHGLPVTHVVSHYGLEPEAEPG